MLVILIGGEHFFLNPRKKIEKYIPLLKKRSFTKSRNQLNFTAHLRVKFYVQAISQTRLVQHYLSGQVSPAVVEWLIERSKKRGDSYQVS